MNHQLSAKVTKHLNSCIQIKSIRINRRFSVTTGVDFCLDPELLAKISQIRASNCRLKLDLPNLTSLRYYALQNLPLASIWSERASKLHKLAHYDSTLTFSTQYSPNHSQSASTLIRSAINLEGKISQQVKHQLWQDSLLLEQVSQAHYWLIEEILTQLPLQPSAWHLQFMAACKFLSLALIYSLAWSFLPVDWLLKIVICLSIILLLKLSFKLLIVNQIKVLIVSCLLNGILAQTIIGKKISINILSVLIALD